MYYGSSMEDKSCEGSSSLRYVNRFKSSASSRPSKRLWKEGKWRAEIQYQTCKAKVHVNINMCMYVCQGQLYNNIPYLKAEHPCVICITPLKGYLLVVYMYTSVKTSINRLFNGKLISVQLLFNSCAIPVQSPFISSPFPWPFKRTLTHSLIVQKIVSRQYSGLAP